MARELKMCIVDPALVSAIEPLVGGQSAIMQRCGISWNSWIKIVGGLPVTLAVAERLRVNVLRQLEAAADLPPHLAGQIPASAAVALERPFSSPVTFTPGERQSMPALRSVRRARAHLATRRGGRDNDRLEALGHLHSGRGW
jgi:hypothetical protein